VDTELGKERRTDSNGTHGGINVDEFIGEFKKALHEDILEFVAGTAENMRRKIEDLFNVKNH